MEVNKRCRSNNKRPYTIVVEGNIGSGKTTFLQPFATLKQVVFVVVARTLAVLNYALLTKQVEVVEEPVKEWRNLDNGRHNLLELMYTDPTRWSLLFQTYVQLTMVKQHSKPSTKPIRIMERSLLRFVPIELPANIFLVVTDQRLLF